MATDFVKENSETKPVKFHLKTDLVLLSTSAERVGKYIRCGGGGRRKGISALLLTGTFSTSYCYLEYMGTDFWKRKQPLFQRGPLRNKVTPPRLLVAKKVFLSYFILRLEFIIDN